MKFGEFSTYDALGIELAHDVKCSEKTLKKGHVLTSSDIGMLQYAGIKSVVGARFTSEDVVPETAADILLKAIVGDHLRYTLPDKDGYSEIFADIDGVFVYETDRLNRLNANDETVSLTAVQPYMPVYKGQFIGNLRLFGPAINANVLNEAITKVSGIGPLLKIAPYAFCKIAFIKTLSDRDRVPQIDEDELKMRFAGYGLNLISHNMCEHTVEQVEKAVRDAIEDKAEIVLVESPFAPVHRDDVVPTGFKESASDIDRLGWPLDTGLSVVLAHKGDVKLIGYGEKDTAQPAFDTLLRYLATKSLPDPEVFSKLSVGGVALGRMTKIITPAQAENSVAVGTLSDSEKIAVVILAAGSSRRMIGADKLLETVNGLPIIDHVVRSALSSKADYVAVVTGHDANFIEKRLEQYDVKIVRNADYVSGVLGSARLGLAVLPPDIAGAIVLPADMPAFTEEYLDKLIDAFDAKASRPPVVMPTYNGVRFNPVLWPHDLFKSVKIIPEDSHWTPALIEHSDYIKEVPLKDDLPLTDINTRGDLQNYKARVDMVSSAEQDLLALEKGR